ncbi:MAG: hypothetical protein NZ733_04350 [Aigarchaeota archaeon]|nr:hypothetical protein [Aigarchaeota archaeon]MDW8043996.1 hypothetical protein [Nitrososphaerota archaeon]
MSQAVSFERLLLSDRMKRVLFAELMASTALVAVLMAAVNRLPFEGAVVGGVVATAVAVVWARWEAGRRLRRLTTATVVRTFLSHVRDHRHPPLPFGPFIHPYVQPLRGYLVEAMTRNGPIRYVDHEPRTEGERVLLLLDGRGRVLAASRAGDGVRLDLLLRLGQTSRPRSG